ncbi:MULTISPECIES: hypothetical protein [unclassified Bradyrhizobium]|uniref:hypothetical protein n=1 Tax=unclassified Bradyrhizobium TaxID=2631580 RepID=UPI00211F19C0|nr:MULTISPECIES: hypothetical protein [unclassified Bradyrhizobium]MDD1532706.1 hypothetical protein [Bradyrhizobium sp. WBOS8]MDD1581618.1 hypothetical protein [Bradyrhizobium sp. WBOS4]UUO49889.1 hypothetical protein DCM78_25060 [Bradyrhizobium sp. WBOS04]UUO58656.1 hypothetical protein DCM80_05340 [Bradyrhizobium sp. WBOS08]
MNDLVVDATFGTDIHDLTPAELEFIAENKNRPGYTIVNSEYMARLYDELNKPVTATCLRRAVTNGRALRIDKVRTSFLAMLLGRAIEARAQDARLAPQ